jgi:heme exporter protein D
VLGGVLSGFAPFLAAEAAALLLFGLIVRAIWRRRAMLRKERARDLYTALFGEPERSPKQ